MAMMHSMTPATTVPPITFGNMREQGVQHLLASCLNDACRHQALIDVSSYPPATEVHWFKTRVTCGKSAGAATRSTCVPTGKNEPGMPSDWRGRPTGVD